MDLALVEYNINNRNNTHTNVIFSQIACHSLFLLSDLRPFEVFSPINLDFTLGVLKSCWCGFKERFSPFLSPLFHQQLLIPSEVRYLV